MRRWQGAGKEPAGHMKNHKGQCGVWQQVLMAQGKVLLCLFMLFVNLYQKLERKMICPCIGNVSGQ